MAYLVRITPRARRDLELLFEAIHARDSETALKWYRGLREALFSLEELPNRCPATPENPQLQHLLYGQKSDVYRVIYRVLEERKKVNVLHIRHGARRKFAGTDVR